MERPIYTPSFVVLGWNTSGRKVNWTGIGCHPEAGLKMVLLYRFSVSSDICSGQLIFYWFPCGLLEPFSVCMIVSLLVL